ncbi:AEC family transporter, partial [Persephonella sp.]
LSRKVGIFDEKSADTIIKFIIYFAFPSLVIYNVYNLEVKPSFLWIILSGWGVIIFSIAISFYIGKLLKLNRSALIAFVMMSSFGNTSFLGFPFQMAILGEEGLRFAVVFDQLASFLPVSLLSPFILSYGISKSKISIDFKKLFTFPPFIALIFGFFIKFFYLPDFVLNNLKILGMTVIPLALFAVGLNLKLSKAKEKIKYISVIIFIKMIFIPVVVVIFILLLEIQVTVEILSFLIEICMPPMVLASIFVISAGHDRDIAVSSVGIGIIISFITVPLIYNLLKVLTGNV